MKKIEIYLLMQILKSFFLIFFILIGISWLLQGTRLLNLITIHKVPIIKVFFLSINIIPNIITSILPFIIIISVLLTSIKLYRDKELIALFTLGISSKSIIKPILLFTILVFTSSLFISFYISPYYYNIFKKDEFDLRNNLDIKNIGLNNFFNFNDEIIINFEKNDNQYVNLFIFQKNPVKNIILANKAEMDLENNILNLNLFNGYKTEIFEKSNETLTYDQYSFSLNLDNNKVYDNSNSNTFNLNKLLGNQNPEDYLIINQRIVDSLMILSLIFIIIRYLLIRLEFSAINILSVSILCIIIIFLDNILGNLTMKNISFIFLMYLNLFIPLTLEFVKNK